MNPPWRVARSLDALLAQFNRACPDRSRLADGAIGDAAHASTDSDHNPWYQGIVTARDFTHDPAHGMDINRITDELAASRDSRIKYLIANGMILDSRPGNSPWRWLPYGGVNRHNHHFHLSVMPNQSCDDTRPWDLPMFGTAAPIAAPVHHREDDMAAIAYDYQPTGSKDAAGNIPERHHVFTLPVGSVSLVVGRAWISFKCGFGPAKRLRLMAIGSGEPGAQYLADKTWTDVSPDKSRPGIEAPSGTDQFTAMVQSEYPYSLGIETQAK